MPKVAYGHKTIEYSFKEREQLKSHYITVDKTDGVILKGKSISDEKAHKLILRKAKWILDKLDLVSSIGDDDIVTGSRIQYLGRKYYVEVFENNEIDEVIIDFTESKFKVSLPKSLNNQAELTAAFETFLRAKAVEKLTPRIKKWSKDTGLAYKNLKIRRLGKRWGSCTPSNDIIINIDAVKLSYSLIDYLLIHELVHTRIKNHSKEFWAELSKHMPNWKELDEKIYGMKV